MWMDLVVDAALTVSTLTIPIVAQMKTDANDTWWFGVCINKNVVQSLWNSVCIYKFPNLKDLIGVTQSTNIPYQRFGTHVFWNRNVENVIPHIALQNPTTTSNVFNWRQFAEGSYIICHSQDGPDNYIISSPLFRHWFRQDMQLIEKSNMRYISDYRIEGIIVFVYTILHDSWDVESSKYWISFYWR